MLVLHLYFHVLVMEPIAASLHGIFGDIIKGLLDIFIFSNAALEVLHVVFLAQFPYTLFRD